MEGKDIVRRLKAKHGELARKLVEDTCDCSGLLWNVDTVIKLSIRKYSGWSSALVFYDENHSRYYIVDVQEDSFSVIVYYSTDFYRTYSHVFFGDELEELYAKVFGMEYVEYLEKSKKENFQAELKEFIRMREEQISQSIEKLIRIVNQTNR